MSFREPAVGKLTITLPLDPSSISFGSQVFVQKKTILQSFLVGDALLTTKAFKTV